MTNRRDGEEPPRPKRPNVRNMLQLNLNALFDKLFLKSNSYLKINMRGTKQEKNLSQ